MSSDSHNSENPVIRATAASIPVRSRRQAMEWSLVLASQGIESAIENSRDSGNGWALLVDPKDFPSALHNLRQYKLENRGWPWVSPSHLPGVSFHWGSLAWAAFLGLSYWASASRPGFIEQAVMNKAAVLRGEWWRLFTAMLLHADLGHLAANLSTGIVLIGLVMGRFGGGLGLLAAYLAGAGGNVAFLLFHSSSARGLGASGMIMGALGMLAVQSLPVRRLPGVARRYWLAGVSAGIMLFILFGLSPKADTVAHLGGFISGLLIGWILRYVPRKSLGDFKWNAAAIVCLAVLVGFTIRMALG